MKIYHELHVSVGGSGAVAYCPCNWKDAFSDRPAAEKAFQKHVQVYEETVRFGSRRDIK